MFFNLLYRLIIVFLLSLLHGPTPLWERSFQSINSINLLEAKGPNCHLRRSKIHDIKYTACNEHVSVCLSAKSASCLRLPCLRSLSTELKALQLWITGWCVVLALSLLHVLVSPFDNTTGITGIDDRPVCS